MLTYSVSTESLVATIDREELPHIRFLLNACLRSRGIEPWSDVEAELFSGRDELLLIARPRSPLQKRPALRRRVRTL